MRKELMETDTWLPVWLTVMEYNVPMISVFPTVKLQGACARFCCVSSVFLFSLWLSSSGSMPAIECAEGLSSLFYCQTASQGCKCVFVRVTEIATMIRPSSFNGDNRRQPWALGEKSTIIGKHRESGWLRWTCLAKLSEEFGISGDLETAWLTSHLWETDELDSYSWESPLHRGRSYIQQSSQG